MPFAVVLTRRALREIDTALGWLSERSPASAARWHRQLLAVIDSLEANPERCSLAPEKRMVRGRRDSPVTSRQARQRLSSPFRGPRRHRVVLRLRTGAQDLLQSGDLCRCVLARRRWAGS